MRWLVFVLLVAVVRATSLTDTYEVIKGPYGDWIVGQLVGEGKELLTSRTHQASCLDLDVLNIPWLNTQFVVPGVVKLLPSTDTLSPVLDILNVTQVGLQYCVEPNTNATYFPVLVVQNLTVAPPDLTTTALDPIVAFSLELVDVNPTFYHHHRSSYTPAEIAATVLALLAIFVACGMFVWLWIDCTTAAAQSTKGYHPTSTHT